MTSVFTSVPRQVISTGFIDGAEVFAKACHFQGTCWNHKEGPLHREKVRKAREVARKSSQRSRKHLSLKPAPGTVVQRVWPATSAVLHVTHSVIHVMEKYVVRQDVLVKEQFWIAPINLRSIRSWGKSCIFRHERLIFRMNASLHHTRNHTLTMFMLAVCVSQKCWWIWPSVCSESFCLLSLFPGPDIENWLTNVQINNN